jgi:hypothetical protein
MRREFSDNSNRLLKDSLTLGSPGFTREIAVPEWCVCAATARFNDLFTMNKRSEGRAKLRARAP